MRGPGVNPEDFVADYALSNVAGTNTITATATPKIPKLLAGQTLLFTPANTNTGAVTLNIDGEGAKNVYRNGAAVGAGDIRANVPTVLMYDGTNFHVVGGAIPSLTRSLYVSFPGTITAAIDGKLRYYPKSSMSIESVTGSAGTAPASANLVMDLKKNGTTIFSGGKPTINIASNTSALVVVSPPVSLTSSDYLTAHIESGDAKDAVMRIDYV